MIHLGWAGLYRVVGEMENPRKYLTPLLWALGLSLLWCLLILPTLNMDAGQSLPGPDGEGYVVKMSRPQIYFFIPGVMFKAYLPDCYWNLVYAVGYSLIGWTVIFFVIFLLAGKSVVLIRKSIMKTSH